MKIARAKIAGVAPYQQSRFHNTPKKEKEGNDDYEKRTWLERCNCDEDDNVFIPPMAFKYCVEDAAKYLSIPIPGKGKANYTKHFKSGILVTEPVMLGFKKKDAKKIQVFGSANGRRDGGTRVIKYFPTFPNWNVEVVFYVLDDTITKEIFQQVLEESGRFIGVGTFRPQNGGYYGRFRVDQIKWEEKS